MSGNKREMRVFISSTFRDMVLERDHLVKHAFPKLRQQCEARGVTWGEVDLRWGITNEQQAEGKVLPICLDEVERCRPFFIGILGERYGWVPLEIDEELVRKENWLAEHRERSVTELEILHGVLNNKEMQGKAFFYFRDPAWLESIPDDEISMYIEGPTDQEIEMMGIDRAEQRARERRVKLQDLKKKIENSSDTVTRIFSTPDELVEMVTEDMSRMIDELFPKDQTVDPFEMERIAHHAVSMQKSTVYVKRPLYFEQINRFIEGSESCLLISGASGTGKTSMVANWAGEYRQTHPNDNVLIHFIGSTPLSSDIENLLWRLLGDLRKWYDIHDEIPQNPAEYAQTLSRWLKRVSGKKRCVIILDSLNQLEDKPGVSSLTWLPMEIPSNVRLIVTSLEGQAFTELVKRNAQQLEIMPFTIESKKQMIEGFLRWCHKSLDPGSIQQMIESDHTDSPLYLKLLLEELRLEGKFESLKEQLTAFLKTESIPQLMLLILDRLERDYVGTDRNLVRDAFCYLWASRTGLSEAELLDLLGENGQPLASGIWSPLFYASRHLISMNSGRLVITHSYFRQAIEEKYLADFENQRRYRIQLAEYYGLETVSRWMLESPWQYAKAGEWIMLRDLLLEDNFLFYAYKQIEFEYYAYWVQIEKYTNITFLESLKKYIETPEQFKPQTLWQIAGILHYKMEAKKSIKLWAYLYHSMNDSPDRFRYLETILNYSSTLSSGNSEQIKLSLELMDEGMALAKELGLENRYHSMLMNKSLVFDRFGRIDESISMKLECEKYFRQSGHKEGLQATLANIMSVYFWRGDYDKAIKYGKESRKLSIETGNKWAVVNLDNSLGTIMIYANKLEEAEATLNEALETAREIGDDYHIQMIQQTRSMLFCNLERLEEALEASRESKEVCERIQFMQGLMSAYCNEGSILLSCERFEESLQSSFKAIEYSDIADPDGCRCVSFGNIAAAYIRKGDLDKGEEALATFRQLAIESQKPDSLAWAYMHLAELHLARKQYQEALKAIEEGVEHCSRYGLELIIDQSEILKDQIIEEM